METHYVFFGAVEDIFINKAGMPLIYANRAYGTPLHLRPNSPQQSAQPETLKLGAFHTLGPYVVPKVLQRLVETEHPIDLQIVEGDQRLIGESLKSGAIEVALMYDWDLGNEIENERLEAFKPYALVSDRHPFASKADVRLSELVVEPLILLDAPPSGEFFLSLFRDRGLEPNVRYRTGSLEMVRAMVAYGLGYTVLVTKPASLQTYDERKLKILPITDDLPARHMVFAHRKDWQQSPAAHAFLMTCKELFSES
jgi:DNA-binding transcriptional LysR family regulator